MTLRSTVLLVCGIVAGVVVVHDWYAVKYGIVSTKATWMADSCVEPAPAGSAIHVTAPAPGKHLLWFARSRAKAGWFIVATDSAVFDRIVVQLDSPQPGRTYEIPSECAVYHDRFVPLGGPTGFSLQDHCRGSITVLQVSDDAIRARLDIVVEPHHSMRSSLQMSQEVTFVRGTSEFGVQ